MQFTPEFTDTRFLRGMCLMIFLGLEFYFKIQRRVKSSQRLDCHSRKGWPCPSFNQYLITKVTKFRMKLFVHEGIVYNVNIYALFSPFRTVSQSLAGQ